MFRISLHAWPASMPGTTGARPFARLLLMVGALLALAGCATLSSQPESTVEPAAASGWELVWSDEFDGAALDPADWHVETGAGGWGNNELQFYTDRPENLRLEEGVLIIEAREEDYRGSRYTSARVTTQYRHAFTYGRMEARMQLPTGKGIWPAFWMLGEDMPTAGWPRAGEIDIMENIGQPNTIYGTVHGPGYSGGNGVGGSFAVDEALNQGFHTYAVEWRPGEIRWFLDDVQFHVVTDADVPGSWVYDHPFFLLLNLAVGGNWPGYPDESTVFPQQLRVDYVRVYRDPTLVVQPPRTVHAAEVDLKLIQADEVRQAEVWVKVVDETGAPVEGAVVTAGWLGVTRNATPEGATDATGLAGPFRGRVVSSAKEVSFCVSDIRSPGAAYDKAQNTITCASQTP